MERSVRNEGPLSCHADPHDREAFILNEVKDLYLCHADQVTGKSRILCHRRGKSGSRTHALAGSAREDRKERIRRIISSYSAILKTSQFFSLARVFQDFKHIKSIQKGNRIRMICPQCSLIFRIS
jgi:hypothetical protein